MKIIKNKLPPVKSDGSVDIPKGAWVAIDVEIFEAEKHRLHRPTGRFGCVTFSWDGETVYFIDDEAVVDLAIGRLVDYVWVMHNGMFDIVQLQRWANFPKKLDLWDTQYCEKLLFSGYYDTFDLGNVSRRHLGSYMDKSDRKLIEKGIAVSFDEKETKEIYQQRIDTVSAKEITDEWTEVKRKNAVRKLERECSLALESIDDLVTYSCLDTINTWKVSQKQKRLFSKKLFNLWKNVEIPAMWSLLDSPGVCFNAQQWGEMADENKKKADAIQKKYPINIAAWQQVIPYVKEQYKVVLESTNEKDVLLPLLEKKSTKPALKIFIQDLLNFRGFAKNSTTYGSTVLDENVELDSDGNSIIIPSWRLFGTVTGRLSCRNPNLQNQPSRDTTVFREQYIPRPGNILVIADYSQQEFRIAIHMSGDKDLIASAQDRDADSYRAAAEMRHDREVTKEERDNTKAIALGIDYGMTKYGLSRALGCEVDEAQDFLDRFFERFPGIASLIEKLKTEAYLKGYAETIMGRKHWLTPYNTKSERNALNSPMQGSAGDMIKLAMGTMWLNWDNWFPGVPYGLVLQIHDELVYDVPSEWGQRVADKLSDVMVGVAEEMCPSVKFKADAGLYSNWAEAK